MKRALAFIGLLSFVLAILITGCSPKLDTQKSDKNPSQTVTTQKVDGIPIGMVLSLTGDTSLYGEAAKRGAEMAVEEFNAGGGYQGKKVSLIVTDDEAKPDKSVEVVKRLITQDHVVGLIGSANSGNALAHIQYAQEAKIPEVIPGATGTKITQEFAKSTKNYIFRVAPVDNVQVAKLLDEMIMKKGYKKIGLIHDTEVYGQGGKDDVLRLMKDKYHTKPVTISAFNPNDVTLEQPVQDMKKAGVDAILFYGQAPQSAKLLDARNKGNVKTPVFATWAMGDPLVKKLAGDLVNNNVYFVDSYSIDRSKLTKAFHDKVVAKYNEDIFPIATAQGYDSARLLLLALKKVGPNGVKIRDEIEKTNNFQGITAISAKPFSKTNHEAYGTRDVFIATYKAGAIVTLK